MSVRPTQNDIRQFVVENFLFGQDAPDLSDNDSLLQKGVIDSTGVLELVEFLQSRYGVTVHDSEFLPANLDSIARIVTFIQGKLQAEVNVSAS